MPATLTEPEVGKSVVTESGEEIGTITEVHDNVAAVDPYPSLTEELKRTLGWGGLEPAEERGRDTHRLKEEAVSTVSEDTVVVFDHRGP